MKKFSTILFVIGLVIIGCDESIDPIYQHIEELKSLTEIQFQGKVLNNDINWVVTGWNGNGYSGGGGSFWCVTDDKTIQQRFFSISDTEHRGTLNYLSVWSPAFSTKDSYEIKKSIFDVGKKEYWLTGNSIYDGFTISGHTNDICFSTQYGAQNKSSFEVVKIRELPPKYYEHPDNKRIKLWLIASCNLYACNGQKIGRIENGRFVIEIQVESNG